MTKAFILMTAMPPTKGHLNLIRFGASLGADRVHVIVCTQPHEPFYMERYRAVRNAVNKMGMPYMSYALSPVVVHQLHRELEQDPSAPGFWPMWDSIMREYGATPGDIYVSSELYGQTLAERMRGTFMPYDPNRELYYTKAENIRNGMIEYFDDILPEFQANLRTRITVFGAESTGKTTLSKYVANTLDAHWLFEWARPYLEAVGPAITVDSMTAIWKGQRSIQRHACFMVDKPFVVQDTDLFSTVGYWEQPHWTESLGEVPRELVKDAFETKSDLYVITKSDIPFEADPIRYGGDKRESPDEFWIDVAERYGLNYIVLQDSDINKRLTDTVDAARLIAQRKAESIYYDRRGL